MNTTSITDEFEDIIKTVLNTWLGEGDETQGDEWDAELAEIRRLMQEKRIGLTRVWF